MAWKDPEPPRLGQVTIRDLAFRGVGVLVVLLCPGEPLEPVAYLEVRA